MHRASTHVLVTWPLGLSVGAAAAFILVASTAYGPEVAIAVALAIPCAFLVTKAPERVFLLFVFLLLVLEEFPGELGESVERSKRTLFYSLSLGVKGLTAPDVFLFGLIAAYLFRHMIRGERMPFARDGVLAAMIIFGGMLVVSTVNSFVAGDPFRDFVAYDISSTGGVKLKEGFARLVGFFQIKQFSLLVVSYVAGMFYFRTVEDIRKLFMVFKLAIAVTLLIGLVRLITNPQLIVAVTPIFYDTPTIWIFAAVLFYCVCVWVMNESQVRPRLIHVVVLVLMLIFILTSFRRTMWGGIAFSGVVLYFLLPRGCRGRYLLLSGLGLVAAVAALVSTPAGQQVLEAVFERARATTTAEASTLYRFVLLKYLIEKFWDIPLLGYGVKPLWGERLVLRKFVTNLENVHSLYMWVLLRLGLVGFLAYAVGTALAFGQTVKVYFRTRETDLKILLLCVILLVLMFLFSGIFNPVYAESRYIFILGFAMALVSRLDRINATGAVASAVPHGPPVR